MTQRTIIPAFIIGAVLVSVLFYTSGCANIVPPMGGYRDSLPPMLNRVSPPDSSLDFEGNRIVFTFDEYIDVDNYMQNLIVSPIQQSIPTVTRKLNTVTLKFRDTLEANTTYTLNFGNAIKDINEGNIKRNFTYVFSTGNYLDSLRFSGNVIKAETGDIDTTLTIMLHRSGEDSIVSSQKPRYITRTNGQGQFTLRNLPPGTFYVYALKDESGSYRYMQTDQLFAFADSAVHVSDSTPNVTLYAYSVPKVAQPVTTTTTRPGRATDKRLKFTTNLQAEKQDLLETLRFTFDTPIREFDSTRVRFTADSAYTPIETGYRWEMDSTSKVLTLHYPWQEKRLYHLILEKDFATDTLGQQLLKSDTVDFTTKALTDYGKLSLRFRNLDLSRNPVLLFVLNNEVRRSFPLSSDRFQQDVFPPGEYSLRILNDENGNGKWDPGEFFGVRRQPEKVKPVQRKINVRPGRENEFEIDINATAEETRAPGSRPGQRPQPARTGQFN